MKVALYARVSTSDKDQDPATQLLPLRDFCTAQGWEVYREYVDQAPANDLAHRIQWRQLLDDAAKRRFSVVLVFKLDRAFRSVKHMHDTLAAWELVAALAEFELELNREKVKAGMERARRQGHRIGRSKVTDREGFTKRLGNIPQRLIKGDISRRQAAKELNIGYATLKRLLDFHT